jgi:hypothetical protein
MTPSRAFSSRPSESDYLFEKKARYSKQKRGTMGIYRNEIYRIYMLYHYFLP